MKKSLLALAVLGLFAGAASAQSSVTISGKIDQSVGKKIGVTDKAVMDNAGSRIGFSGFEAISADLGAVFAFEHRFFPDDGTGEFSVASPNTTLTPVGANPSANKFWNGFALVGIRSASMGTVTLGRQYTSAFLLVQNQIDPFEGEGVGALRNIAIGAAGPAKVRVDNSIKYAHKFGPVSISADVAEAQTYFPSTTPGPDKAISVAANGTFGPVWLGVAYEDASGAADDVLNIGARANIGPVALSGMYTTGSSSATTDITAFLLGAKIKVGAGDIKVGYVTRKNETGAVSTTVNQRFALGYDHNLSKRTKAYVQFAQESKLTANKSGYEVGVQHKF